MNRFIMPTIIIGLIFFFVGITILGDHGFLHLLKMDRGIERIKTETSEIKEENRQLKKQVLLLQHNAHYQEMVVRQELKMIKANEQVFVFREP